MTRAKLHEDEVLITDDVVRDLIKNQVPPWADLPITEAPSSGTVDAIFRLGTEMYVRLPRAERFVGSLNNELKWLPILAPHLSLALPTVLARGEAGTNYPFPWAIFRWLEGDTYSPERISDEREEAVRLGQFLLELQVIDHAGGPRSHGDAPITDDEFTKQSIKALPATFDHERVALAWEFALRATPWDGSRPVWIHGDLIPPNVLVHEEELKGLLDFGDVGLGDSAVDLIPAWSLFDREGRNTFRTFLEVDDQSWNRARALALRQAIRIIPYYRDTHHDFVAMATKTVQRVLETSRHHVHEKWKERLSSVRDCVKRRFTG